MRLFKFLPLFFLALYTLFVFRPFFQDGKLPIPADTIVGLYHPWRDLYADKFPNGIPFKNFLITDPVRQQYPWRELAFDQIKKGQIPWWNPYNGLSSPLLANIQTAVFYPLNLIYFLLPFSWGWSIQIVLQVVLGGFFMWLFLKNLKLSPPSCALGVLTWVGSGFFIAWLEWNTLVQVAIWLPLLLIAIDRQKTWLLTLALSCSFFAGHLQIFLYVAALVFFYGLYHQKLSKKIILGFLLALVITSVQWLPMIPLFGHGVRTVSGQDWQKPGWFLPWQNLVQFIAPDFFGNPATLNYFGIWNYGEFIGYVGLFPLLFAIIAINKKNIFWVITLAVSLIFSLSNPIAKLVPQLVQPTRLLVLTDFSLALLAAFGVEEYLKNSQRIHRPIIFVSILIIFLWITALKLNLPVSQKNLILPTLLLFLSSFSVIKNKFVIFFILIITVFDLSRFAIKFESFSDSRWLFPETKITQFLQNKSRTDVFRVVALDDRIFPPNFSTHYKIQMASNYDSIFLKNYQQIFQTSSRISTPKDYFENVRYVLSFDDLDTNNFELILVEGQTKLYEKKQYSPRAFFSNMIGAAKIEKYSANEIIITTTNSDSDALILLDIFYPQWKAEIDGQIVPIKPAGVYRALDVPEGNHQIIFRI